MPLTGKLTTIGAWSSKAIVAMSRAEIPYTGRKVCGIIER
jgi:hypothetical protein